MNDSKIGWDKTSWVLEMTRVIVQVEMKEVSENVMRIGRLMVMTT